MAAQDDFIKQYLPLAQQVGQQLKVAPENLIAQWGLETGWGRSVVPGTNNLGNIKDFSKAGTGVSAVDNMTGSTDRYRQYETPEAFGQDFTSLLSNPRYAGALNTGDDAQAFATGLKKGGYAEDPDYVRKLVATANSVRQKTGVAGTLDRIAGGLMGSAQAAGAPDIDWNSVKWEDSAPTTTDAMATGAPIDWNTVQWDEAPAEKGAVVSGIEALGRFGRGAWQGLTDIAVGTGQNAAQEGATTLGAIDQVFGTNLAPQGRARADELNSQAQARERDYQAATPDSIAAGFGRFAGNVASSGGTGAGLRTATGVGEALLANSPRAGRLLGSTVGSAGLGAATAAGTPVTGEGSFDDQRNQQILTGAAIGGVIPGAIQAVGAGAGTAARTVRGLVEPFSEAGRGRIADRVISRAAQGGPVAPNTQTFIQGSEPTLAQATGNPGVAGLERGLRNDPRYSPQFYERDVANRNARSDAFDRISGSAEDVSSARAARDSQANSEVSSLFALKQPAETEPVLEVINGILKGSSGKREAVKNSVSKIKRIIQKGDDPEPVTAADGSIVTPKPKLERDPATLYDSARKQIGDMLDKANLTDPSGRQASRELLQIRDALDESIESGAPGFKDYLANYSKQSQPINAMEFLQNLRLTDSKGNMTLAKVQGAMENIRRQLAAGGTNEAKSLSESQLQTLGSIRDDLLRASNTGAGSAVGSSTAQNLAIDNMLADVLPGGIGQVLGRSAAGGMINRLGQVVYGGTQEPIRQEIVNRLLNTAVGAKAINPAPVAQSLPVQQLNRLAPYVLPAVTFGAVQSNVR